MDKLFAISPRWIIPVVLEGICWENHSLIIEAGRIKQILPTPDLSKDIPAHTLLSVLCPGFVNAHTHSPMTLLRGLADDLPLMTWLNETIWPVERQCLDQDFIADGTELAIAEMIQSGTTCFNEHYFQAEVIAVLQRNMVCVHKLVFGSESSQHRMEPILRHNPIAQLPQTPTQTIRPFAFWSRLLLTLCPKR